MNYFLNLKRRMEIDVLKKYKNDIIRNTLKKIYKNYIVVDPNTNDIISLECLNNKLKEEIKRCIGVNNNKQCTKNAESNESYCKLHIKKYTAARQKDELKIEIECDERDERDKSLITTELKDVQKKFIDGKMYYIDDKYIYEYNYDNSTLYKVGYIKNNEYYITCDPFVLSLI